MNAIGWFEIYVTDMARARAFYETVLACTLDALHSPSGEELEMLSFPMDFEQYGAGGALVHMPGVSPGNGGTLVYFSCEDCALPESRVVAAGGRVERPKMSIGEYGFISLVVDTEGNVIGLHSQQ